MYSAVIVAALVTCFMFAQWIIARRATRKLRERLGTLRAELERLLTLHGKLIENFERELENIQDTHTNNRAQA